MVANFQKTAKSSGNGLMLIFCENLVKKLTGNIADNKDKKDNNDDSD